MRGRGKMGEEEGGRRSNGLGIGGGITDKREEEEVSDSEEEGEKHVRRGKTR